MNGRTLARAHGAFNLASGLWPLLHLPSFEAVMGPKEDDWLVKAMAGLLVGAGLTQLLTPDSEDGVTQSGRIGVGVAATLAAVDYVYVPRGRISPVYLVDSLFHVGWLAAWTAHARRAVAARRS